MVPVKGRVICFDMDGIICSQTDGDYENAVPNQEAIEVINRLANEGNRIIICTSRFMGRNNNDVIETYKNGYEFTLNQLRAWKVKFHELHLGKQRYDVLVDDRAVFFKNDWNMIYRELTMGKD